MTNLICPHGYIHPAPHAPPAQRCPVCDPIPPADPAVRTHSLSRILDGSVLVCRGCGERWLYAENDPKVLEQQPCGTRKKGT